MTALNTYRRWLARVEDDALRAELSALDEVRDAAQIEDRFYRDLAFGTGGLRGVLGAGTNRMNVYVVRPGYGRRKTIAAVNSCLLD